MPTLIYNGVSLPFQVTDEADEQVVMSDDGADYLHTRKSYSVTSTLTAALVPAGLTFATWIATLQHDLKRPRCPLVVDFGGAKLVTSDANADVKNGPTPEVLGFTKFAGYDACTVRFRVTTCVLDCDRPDRPQVLSHRWTESVSIRGDTFLTTRRRTGKVIIRPGRLTADDFRGVATPPIPTGFVRESADYEVQSDGLALSYTFVDAEVYATPPPGAIRAKGNCRITAEKGIFKYAEVSLTLQGDARQNKQSLVQLGAAVCMERLDRTGLQRDSRTGRWQMTTGMVSENLYENEVTVSVRALIAPPKRPVTISEVRAGGVEVRPDGFNAVLGRPIVVRAQPGDDPRKQLLLPWGAGLESFGFQPYGSDPARSPDMGLRSTAGLRLIAAALNDPCLTEALLSTAELNELRTGASVQAVARSADQTRSLTGTAVRPAAATVTVTELVRDPSPPQEYSDGGVYTDYRLHLEVQERARLAEMPEQREGGSVRFVRLSRPTVRLVVRWKAERVGEPPAVPDQDLTDDNAVFLEGNYSPGTTEVAEDGITLIHTSAGEYVYGFKDPTKAKIGAGLPPWVAELVGQGDRPVVYDGPPGVDPGSLVVDALRQINELIGGPR